jgi:hypothetical protein
LGIRPKLGFEIRLRSDGMIQFTGKPEDEQIFALWQRKYCPKNVPKTGSKQGLDAVQKELG